MADEAVVSEVFDRLVEEDLAERVSDAVLAALHSDDALDRVIGGATPDRPTLAAAGSEGQAKPVDGAYLTAITVRSFRGIGPEATLALQPGPGLTVVHGGNGSGKSSFAEALEIALTGDAHRFNRGGKVWRDGWRNLHATDAPRIIVSLHLPGTSGVSTIERSWSSDDLTASTAVVKRPGQPHCDPAVLGWSKSLEAMRPICSSAEIESLIEQTPSALHDRLSNILGLDSLHSGIERLKSRAEPLKAQLRARDEAKKQAKQTLAELTDERAVSVLHMLRRHQIDLAAIETAVGDGEPATATVAALRVLAELPGPDLERVGSVTDALIKAARVVVELGTPENRLAQLTVDILQRALEWHGHAGDSTCPVCASEGRLDEAWRERTSGLVGHLASAAADLDHAERQLTAAVEQARSLTRVPTIPDPGLESVAAKELLDSWRSWESLLPDGADPNAMGAVARLLEAGALELAALHDAATSTAAAELDARETVWRDAAAVVRDFVTFAKMAEPVESVAETLVAAARWLEGTEQALRNERLAAVRERACAYWDKLRQRSSVELSDYSFTGRGTQRKVSFDVAVDGVKSQALGVMSQGELNALALSIFLPRATQPESPFRFCVIDDPVQAMDPAKVGGLARVLHELSAERQVVVFTHDLRLVDALEHLGISASIVEVVRGTRSEVTVHLRADAATRFLADARALTLDPDVPDEVIRRVVPNLCRQALEEALARRYRRERLAAGEHHDDIEAKLTACTSTNATAALVLCGSADRGANVLPTLNREFRRSAGDVFADVKKYGHTGTEDADRARALIDPATRLCADLGR